MTPRTNDLLRLHARASLILDAPAPEWVAPSLAGIPWVVVRRGESRNDVIPVSVRGLARSERFKALVSVSGVAYRVTPEELADRRSEPWRAAQVPALAALARVDPVLTLRGHRWGPVGSVGFELATSLPAANPTSDLDLVLRLDDPLGPREARKLLRELVEAAAPARADVVVETRLGSVNLGDLALRSDRVLMKTANGIRLIADPWQEAA